MYLYRIYQNILKDIISFYCVHTSGLNLSPWISTSESYFSSHPSDQYLGFYFIQQYKIFCCWENLGKYILLNFLLNILLIFSLNIRREYKKIYLLFILLYFRNRKTEKILDTTPVQKTSNTVEGMWFFAFSRPNRFKPIKHLFTCPTINNKFIYLI